MSDNSIDRQFSKEDTQTAKELARDYHITIESHEDLTYVGFCTEMPTVMNDGGTKEECKENVREAIVVVLSYMLEAGIPIPQPNSLFDSEEYKSFKKVAGIEMHTKDLQHFYVHNASGSGNIWETESIDVLKILHTKLGEFIKEIEEKQFSRR